MSDPSNPDLNIQNPHKEFRSFSLRTRLTLSTMAITALTIMVLGYFIYNRAQQSNTYLTEQLDASIRQQAEDTLKTISSEQIAVLNTFFASMSRDVANLGSTAGIMASEENVMNNPNYWDAATALFRLPNNSWDNANEDTASVFIPAAVELTESLASKINSLIHLDLVAPVLLKANPDIIAIYFGGTAAETLYYPNIDLSSLVPPDFDVTQRPWFVSAAPEQNPGQEAVWSAPYLDAALNGLVITTSIPVNDDAGQFQGVAAMDIQLTRITQIISNIRVGDSGYAFLIDGDKRLIAMPDAAYLDFGIAPEDLPLGEKLEPSNLPTDLPQELWSVLDSMSAGENNLETIVMGGTERFVIYGPISETGYSLGIVVPSQELLAGSALAKAQIAQSTQNTILISLGLVLTILLISFIASLFMSNRLMKPLEQLTLAAKEVTAGNLNAQAVVSGKDEIGVLATAFNGMVSQLRGLVGSLEQRVAERTRALTTSTEVSRRLSTILDEKQLVKEVVEQVQDAFDFYHVHIYLKNDISGDLIMAGGTGDAGAAMLARGHKISKGKGLVGRAAETNSSVLVQDTSQDPNWLPNPLLPDTKSEVAVPISIGADVLGVLDVQQNIVSGLNQEDVILLQSIANQVAIGVRNARSYEESRSQAELETLINTIGQKIQRAGTVEDVLQTAIREMGIALGASRVSASLQPSRTATESYDAGGGNGADPKR
jgi:putative methionine-R-sulfoxide reductase with GAF domain